MADQHEMRLCDDGVIRAVYTDVDGTDVDGDEYYIVDGEKNFLETDEEEYAVVTELYCAECGETNDASQPCACERAEREADLK